MSTEAETFPPTEPVSPETTAWIPAETTLLPETTEAAAPAETASQTLPAETEAIPEETPPPEETAAETEPPEETAAETEPSETLPAETEAALPPETSAAALPAETQPTETEAPTLPPETEATQPPESYPVQVMTIAQARAMAPGTEGITIRGTVVYAKESQAVIQDDTGGIRLSFSGDPGAVPGEILQVTGTRTGGLFAEDFENLGLGDLPAAAATLLDAPEELRVRISGARVTGEEISQGGFSLTLAGPLPGEADTSQRLDVWGVILDGCFYPDAAILSTQPEPADADAGAADQPWNIYFGQLHAHTEITTPVTDPSEAFSLARDMENMDFFAITNASESFDNAVFGTIHNPFGSQDWTNGRLAAQEATKDGFLAIFGYEMAWPKGMVPGHISTFCTPGWQAWTQEGMETLEKYCTQLAMVPQSVSQFNHPGQEFGTFHQFSRYDPAQDQVIHLLELDPEGHNPTHYYDMALQKGWHLAPSLNGGDTAENAGQVRTAVLAESLTEDSLFSAIQALRVYATWDPDLQLVYRLNGESMGGTLGPAEALEAQILLQDPTDSGSCRVEVVTEKGTVQEAELSGPGSHILEITEKASYYYLRLLREDTLIAVTAPVWMEDYEDMGIQCFASSEAKPMEGQEVTLSLELYNRERLPFVIESLAVYVGEEPEPFHSLSAPGTVGALDQLYYSFPASWDAPGPVTFRAEITGTMAGYRRSFSQTLTVYYQPKEAEPSPISAVRQGILGAVYRVNGYITAGNHNPYTTFPGTLYVQDDSGGIAVLGYPEDTLQVGQPVCITGILAREEGNLVLKLLDCTLREATYYRYAPETSPNKTAADSDAHGGELMQVEGEVVSLQKTADGRGLTRLTLKDRQGDLATVVIDSCIRSGAYGTNTLTTQIKKGRTARALGLVHRDEYGAVVLRARNCDEVVYVPARMDPTNPSTGDPLWFLPNWLLFWL